jgi:hypothetical protein
VLRAAISYALSRVAALTVIALAVSFVVHASCRPAGALGGLYGRMNTSFDDINRALTAVVRF